MSLPENDYQILKLTDDFYNTYSNPPYAEIMKKRQRAYTCILFQTHYGYFICVPYRTEIPHKYAYHFKNSKRSQAHKSRFVGRVPELSLFYRLFSPYIVK